MHEIFNTVDGLYVVGSNNQGELGSGDNTRKDTPTKINFDHDVISVHTGENFTIINTTDGLYSCGKNYYGQLGLGLTNNVNILKRIDFNNEVYNVGVGFKHVVFNTQNGLYSFGSNDRGQLGLGHRHNKYVPTKIIFNHHIYDNYYPKSINFDYDIYDVLDIACGNNFTIINTSDGLYSFGTNDYGELGLGSNTFSAIEPRKIKFEHEVYNISCGKSFTILNTEDGLYSFGSNDEGELGLGYFRHQHTPTKIEFDYEISDIYCGYQHTVLNTSDGLYGFGANFNNQLGSKIVSMTVIKPEKINLKDYDMVNFDLTVLDVYCGNLYTVIVLKDILVTFGIFGQMPKIVPFEPDLSSHSIFKRNHSKSARTIVS